MRKKVQMRGGARWQPARRTLCTLSGLPRAPTKQMGLFPHPARIPQPNLWFRNEPQPGRTSRDRSPRIVARDGDTDIATSVSFDRLWPAVLLGLFFLSGISGLIYEVAWTRMLHLLF